MLAFLSCVFFALAFGAARAQTECQSNENRCQAVCTVGAVNGTLVNPALCPVVQAEYGLRPRCDVCPSGRFCEQETGQCLSTSLLDGFPCTANEHCVPFVPDLLLPDYECVANECTRVVGQNIYGDECASDSECFGELTCNMTTGLCDASTLLCSINTECPSAYVCYGGQCVETEYNQLCWGAGGFCPQDQVCNVETQYCQNIFTLSEGANCDSSEIERRLGCAPGFVCAQPGPGQTRVCMAEVAPASPFCNPNLVLECDSQHVCACNETSGVGSCMQYYTEQNCAQSYRDYIRCALQYNCRSERMLAYPGSCIANNCGTRFSSLVSCQLEAQSNFPPSCNIDYHVMLEFGQATETIDAAHFVDATLFSVFK